VNITAEKLQFASMIDAKIKSLSAIDLLATAP
jgi:hypothetical protein